MDRHRCFISYHHANDQGYKDKFVRLFDDWADIFINKSVGDGDIDDDCKTETIWQKIRDVYLSDSTVTIVLIGKETWKRKYVDWEISSSLRDTKNSSRSGLIGIFLPTHPDYGKEKYNSNTIPPRLYDNVECGFARLYDWSDSPKDGMQNFSMAENTMKKYFPLLSKPDTFVTTMFDFYALPSDAPGYEKIEKLADAYDRISCLETALFAKYPNQKFIPYFQLHEFEALVFSNLDKLGELYFESDISELYACLSEIPNPELINNGRETAPSKRILKCIPRYDKATLGLQVLEETDFAQIRKNCRHFDEWISRLEQL